MTDAVRKFVDDLYAQKRKEEESGYIGGVNHFNLTDDEANIVDEAIRLYKLPFEISQDKSGITDLESSEFHRFDDDGFAYIADAVYEDDGETLDGAMTEQRQKTLYQFFVWY